MEVISRMNARHIITFLLVLAISSTAIVYPTGTRARSFSVALEDEPQLTPEELREARELVARFGERWRKTTDYEQIVSELFVQDFPERLRQASLHEIPWWFVDKHLLAAASREELWRFYIATMNLYGLMFRLVEIAQRQKQQSDNSEGDLGPTDVLSPEAINVLRSDPLLALLVEDEGKDEKDGETKETDSHQPAPSGNSPPAPFAAEKADADTTAEAGEEGIVKTIPQLNNMSATLERANALMRKQLASLPPVEPSKSTTDETKNEQSLPSFDLTTLDESIYGYAEGTRVIHTNVLPYCLNLIRVNGQLRILSVSLYVD